MLWTPLTGKPGTGGRRIFVSAGEPSGDVHGGNLVRALHEHLPGAECVGFGGDRMAAAGCHLLYPLCNLAVMGIGPVLAHLPTFAELLGRTDRWLGRYRPDAVVLIDFPGLHWWLARRAKAHGIPVLWFVPPQIWAWATWRVARMRKYVDHVLCSLPFEEPWYHARGVNARYIGHPFFDDLPRQRLDPAFLAAQQARGGRIVGLLPGSRTQEVEHNFKTMVRTALRLHRQLPDTRFLVACFKEHHRQLVAKVLGSHGLPVEAHVGRTPEIIHLAEACVAVSGSVSLELLYRLKPTAIVYKVGSLGLRLAQRFLSSKYITLVNLLADRELYPEFLSDRCQSRAVAQQLHHWLTDPEATRALVADLTELRGRIGSPGACARTAAFVADLVSRRRAVA
jgi:lipid-A-disaccharide synthase